MAALIAYAAASSAPGIKWLPEQFPKLSRRVRHRRASTYYTQGRLAAVGDPMSVAVEHVRWCRTRGDSFAEIIKSVGFVPSGEPDFDETVCILATAVSRWSA